MKHLLFALAACLLLAQPGHCTTIAWDGTSFACDSQRTRTNSKIYTDHKIVFVKEQAAYVGIAGDCPQAEALIDYFRRTGAVTVERLKNIEVIMVYTDGRVLYYNEASDRPTAIEGPFAIGSGEDFALAAMYLGKTAEEAVRTAEALDIFTGGKIHTYKPVIALRPESSTKLKP
jgi:ATP-dependent protease HslVU (ClpYQ) peptidase subunit